MSESRSIEDHFADWEAHVFGYGYGSGEYYVLSALKDFMAAVGREDAAHGYDFRELEKAVSPTVAWLLINTLCRCDMIEYGTSPRYGWLSKYGEALKAFVDSKSVEELYDIVRDKRKNSDYCEPNFCNCGPDGYSETKICHSPFWYNKGDKWP